MEPVFQAPWKRPEVTCVRPHSLYQNRLQTFPGSRMLLSLCCGPGSQWPPRGTAREGAEPPPAGRGLEGWCQLVLRECLPVEAEPAGGMRCADRDTLARFCTGWTSEGDAALSGPLSSAGMLTGSQGSLAGHICDPDCSLS